MIFRRPRDGQLLSEVFRIGQHSTGHDFRDSSSQIARRKQNPFRIVANYVTEFVEIALDRTLFV